VNIILPDQKITYRICGKMLVRPKNRVIVIFNGTPSPGAHGKPETVSFNLIGNISHFRPEIEISVEQPLYEEQILNLKFDKILKIEDDFDVQIFETAPIDGNITLDRIILEDLKRSSPREFHCDIKSLDAEGLAESCKNGIILEIIGFL